MKKQSQKNKQAKTKERYYELGTTQSIFQFTGQLERNEAGERLWHLYPNSPLACQDPLESLHINYHTPPL